MPKGGVTKKLMAISDLILLCSEADMLLVLRAGTGEIRVGKYVVVGVLLTSKTRCEALLGLMMPGSALQTSLGVVC